MTTMITDPHDSSQAADAAKLEVGGVSAAVTAHAEYGASSKPRKARTASKLALSTWPACIAAALTLFVLDKLFAP